MNVCLLIFLTISYSIFCFLNTSSCNEDSNSVVVEMGSYLGISHSGIFQAWSQFRTAGALPLLFTFCLEKHSGSKIPKLALTKAYSKELQSVKTVRTFSLLKANWQISPSCTHHDFQVSFKSLNKSSPKLPALPLF